MIVLSCLTDNMHYDTDAPVEYIAIYLVKNTFNIN